MSEYDQNPKQWVEKLNAIHLATLYTKVRRSIYQDHVRNRQDLPATFAMTLPSYIESNTR